MDGEKGWPFVRHIFINFCSNIMSIYHIYAIYCKIKQTGVLDYLYSFGIIFFLFFFLLLFFKLTHISCRSVSFKCQKLLNKNGSVSCFPIVLSKGISVIARWSVSPPCQQASFIFLFFVEFGLLPEICKAVEDMEWL